ncbi:hypothetical protein [Altericroceibacterium endophyticum]|uniref:DUF3313 family protein n=1 Tax=Altericroceibacterium endophyticum TaxID=1808508 RepID=A0A6I4T8H3_9SPHN|nr:hypothetical protein [Altericroceibacterium endophyticum]MXO66978.1 hypothetical protein [Altericroceibacterium endophyticum]
MSILFRCGAIALLLAGCAPENVAAEPRDLPRLVPDPIQRDDRPTILRGWHEAHTTYSDNRLLPDNQAFDGAVLMTVKDVAVEFEAGLREALAHESVSEPVITARRDLTGGIPDMFSEAIDNPQGRYSTFTASARTASGPVQIAGFWLQTPQGEDIGATFEMFVAPPDIFAAMGGWFVPAARYFDISFVDPAKADLLAVGTAPPDEAAQSLAQHFGDFMSFILQSQALISSMQQQTLSIQQGLDQTNPRGLQDPMYKP